MTRKVIIMAPHPDDEILGCGGTIAKHVDNGDEVYVIIATKGCMPLFTEESVQIVRQECIAADKFLGVKNTIFLDFPASMMERVERYELNGKLIEIIQEIQPNIVYIPHHGDMQLDHKLLADACMVALRPKYEHVVERIYAYETLSETGWNIPDISNEFIPTVYNDISCYIEKKIEAMKKYNTQLAEFPNTRSVRAIKALAMYRGALISVKAAEAFALIRQINI